MLTDRKRKLAVVILEYLLISVLISAFVFCFLYFMSGSVAENYFVYQGILLTSEQRSVFNVWRGSVCVLAALIVFVVLFLFMLGQRLSYLIRIIRGVEKMQEQNLEGQIELEGSDELTELAEAINFMAASKREADRLERQMQEEKEAWIRAMSHDIRTPLTTMLSYSEFLLDGEEPSRKELWEALRLMREKTLQIRELTDRLMRGKPQRREYLENVAVLFFQLAQEWEDTLEERFSSETDLSGLSPFDGEADIFSLRRIFHNLLSNVEKYADEKREVSLKIENQGNRISIIQENSLRTGSFSVESHRIGLESIRQTAAEYQGSVDVDVDERRFRIRIKLQIPSALQNSSEISS